MAGPLGSSSASLRVSFELMRIHPKRSAPGLKISAAAVARVALGEAPPPAPPAPEPRSEALLGALRAAHSGHWPVLR